MKLRVLFIVIMLAAVVLIGNYLVKRSNKKVADSSMRLTPTATNILSTPENAIYMIDNNLVILKNGVSEQQLSGSATKITTRIFGKPIYGDLNGDGVKDAALMLEYDPGGSGTFYYVVAAINEKDEFHGTNAIFIGDRIAPQNIQIEGSTIIANYVDRKPGEPLIVQPSIGISKYFYFNGSILKEKQK